MSSVPLRLDGGPGNGWQGAARHARTGTVMSSIGWSAAGRAARPALALVALVFVAAPGAAAPRDPLLSLTGMWRGPVTENGLNARVGEVRAVLDLGDPDVSARWTALDGQTAKVELSPTARPNVLAQQARGLGAMLGGGRSPDPLGGEPMLWGRRDEHGLYVYRVQIGPDGALTLDRYGFEPAAGDTVTFTASRADPKGGELGRVRATLTRQAP